MRKGETENASCAGLFERFGYFDKGTSRCKDIVNDDDVLISDELFLCDAKTTTKVFCPLFFPGCFRL